MSTASAFIGQKYAFASGRTGVLRQSLVTQSDVDRLLGCHDLRALEAILTELKFTNEIDQGLTGTDHLLRALEEWVIAEVRMMVPEDKLPIFNILWVNGDAPLLAWLLKKSLGLAAAESAEPTSGLHAFDADALRSLVDTGTSDTLPQEFITLVADARTLTDLTADMVDTLVEKAVTSYRLSLAKMSGSKDILRYVRTSIDLSNIRTALRMHAAERTDPAPLLDGGTLRHDALLKGPKGILRGLASSDLSLRIGNNPADLLSDPLHFERKAADILADDIGRMWNVPLTVEPVFAFAAIALSHMNLIRVIAIGKRSALSPQDIKLILPPFIPASRFSS